MWLNKVLSKYNDDNNTTNSNKLKLPLKPNGELYCLNELIGSQKMILYHVIDTVKKWITMSPDYKPFHRIISGGGGSGKSFIIHQITTAIRKMFNKTETVETAAFTGSAAYNIGGKTLHSLYAVDCIEPDKEMSQTNRENLIRRLRHTVALLIDERSMLSAELLGAVERNIALTCHGGNKFKHKWGGIPVVLMIGDDYQLPPVQIMGKGKGAFHALDYRPNKNSKGLCVEVNGMNEFLRMSKKGIILDTNKRVIEGQEEFKQILSRVRLGKPTEQDKDILLSLCFHKLPSNIRQRFEKSSDTIYLFATREMCSEHNFKKLAENNDRNNPVAFIKHKLPRHWKSNKNDQTTIPDVTCFSRGCKVSIKGKNFCPLIGLYNGAIGTVKEIVFKPGDNPNTGQLPLYIAVDFPGYVGHLPQHGSNIWDDQNPTTIPIPMVDTIDEKTKKSIKYCPLVLSFARTIHTFQGQSAGPTNNNNINPVMRIICDVGTPRFESQNIGLFYTALSRATTIGSESNSRHDSAIFFTHSLDKTRLDRLTTKVDNTDYDMIHKRTQWVTLIEKHVENKDGIASELCINRIFQWAEAQHLDIKDIDKVINT